MNTNNEFQLIWEYNLLRAFVRHVFMATWNEKEGINEENVLNLDIEGLLKNPSTEENSFLKGRLSTSLQNSR